MISINSTYNVSKSAFMSTEYNSPTKYKKVMLMKIKPKYLQHSSTSTLNKMKNPSDNTLGFDYEVYSNLKMKKQKKKKNKFDWASTNKA